MSTSSRANAIRIDTYSDDTGPRIMAFLASMQLMNDQEEGCVDIEHARELIKRLAESSEETDHPTTVLSLSDCAEILWFLAKIEPIEKQGWWIDTELAPSHVVGLQFVLFALEKNLRRAATTMRRVADNTPKRGMST